MIKVLDKTFAILEEIVKAVPSPVTPLEIAEKLSLNRPTCSRIIRTLVDSGYVIQVSRQAGYTAGPKILTLNNMAAFQNKLLQAAVPVAEKIAAEFKDAAMITQVWQQERYILHLANRNPVRKIRLKNLSYNDVYTMATGVLEMAYVPLREAMAVYDNTPAEAVAEILPDFRRRSGVPEQLERIRRKEYYYFDRGEISIFAAPIFCNGIFTASFGFSTDSEKCTGDGFEQVLVSIRNAAAEISRSLSVSDTIG